MNIVVGKSYILKNRYGEPDEVVTVVKECAPGTFKVANKTCIFTMCEAGRWTFCADAYWLANEFKPIDLLLED